MGVLYRSASGLVLGGSVVRAFRAPDITELYSEGPHLAAYVFEVGNPSLEAEKGHVALKYERPSWYLRAETEMANRQDRVGEFETPTSGYAVFNASAGVRLTFAGRLNILTVSLVNAANAEYRNHLSRVKEIMPEAARGLNATYRVVF